MKEFFDAELFVLKEITAGKNRQRVDVDHRSQLFDFFKRGTFETSFQSTEIGSTADLREVFLRQFFVFPDPFQRRPKGVFQFHFASLTKGTMERQRTL